MKHFEELTNFIKTNKDWLNILKPYLKSANVCTYHTDWTCLMYNLFDIPKDENLFNIIKECRGTVVNNKTGEIICAPFIKFWNYGEQYADEIDWKTAEVSKKRDGWLVKVFKYNDHCYIMTNGAFLSSEDLGAPIDSSIGQNKYNFITDVVKTAFVNAEPNTTFQYYSDVSEIGGLEVVSNWTSLIPNGSTIMLELESEANVIHTHIQKEPKVWLIGFRNELGNELTKQEAKNKYSLPFDIPEILGYTDIQSLTKDLHKWNAEVEGEGVVVCDANFKRIKIKCDDYLRIKYIASFDDLSDSHLFAAIIENEIDDILAVRPSLKTRIDFIKEKIRIFTEYCEKISVESKRIFNECNGNKGLFANRVKDLKNKSLYFSLCQSSVDSFIEREFNLKAKKKNGYKDILCLIEDEKDE